MNILAQHNKNLRERNANTSLRVHNTSKGDQNYEEVQYKTRGGEEIGLPRGTGGETNTRRERNALV